ncbi:MAG: transglutaminase-like cysteine peptidase [Kiloniellaceae bacterium]
MLSRRHFLAAAATSAVLGISPRRAEAKLVVLPLPPSTPIADGEFVAAPAPWLRMVKRFPSLHPGSFSPCRVASTKVREAELGQVHRLVNESVQFRNEPKDIWEPAGSWGDCEDFAIRKLQILMEDFGWPRGALTLAVCRIETGQRHAVLLAHTSRGVYALDNRQAFVLPWRALDYRWQAREEAGSPFDLWRAIAV